MENNLIEKIIDYDDQKITVIGGRVIQLQIENYDDEAFIDLSMPEAIRLANSLLNQVELSKK
jgi:hypothetical protein